MSVFCQYYVRIMGPHTGIPGLTSIQPKLRDNCLLLDNCLPGLEKSATKPPNGSKLRRKLQTKQGIEQTAFETLMHRQSVVFYCDVAVCFGGGNGRPIFAQLAFGGLLFSCLPACCRYNPCFKPCDLFSCSLDYICRHLPCTHAFCGLLCALSFRVEILILIGRWFAYGV